MKLPKSPRAVVTGAGSGLGRALALELAKRQARVLATDLDEARAAAVAAEVTAAGGEGAALVVDVSDPAALERAAEEAERLWGGTDLLVNNAGVACAGPVGEVPLADWNWTLSIDLMGVVHGCHSFIPRMKARKSGAILNVASCAGVACIPEMGPYNVAKAGVIALTETLYSELAPHGISAAVLCPTFFKTRLMETFRSPSERQRRFANLLFERATSTAEEVAIAGLRGLESSQLIIIPQADGQRVWRAKRLAPTLYHRALGMQQRHDLIGRVLRWL
jgi:NAD(P)-dependent dehydrogenase (short-subunit alcohol dehydrogenase family)